MNTILLNRIEKKHFSGTQFSVIIPAHNAEKTLQRAVESVLTAMETVSSDAVIASGLQEDSCPLFEILIIENGSEDATEFLARRLEAENDGFVRTLKSDRGVSNARNRGLEEACGKWVLFLDADDYLIEGAGEVLRDALYFTGTDLIICSYEAGGQKVHLCPSEGERFSGKQLQDIIVRMIENPTRYTSLIPPSDSRRTVCLSSGICRAAGGSGFWTVLFITIRQTADRQCAPGTAPRRRATKSLFLPYRII